uniref:Uncharacterized protein n=1 Tax=Haemonchus contortus TaxID=6289 RepID=A0A7I4Y0I5_HAECO
MPQWAGLRAIDFPIPSCAVRVARDLNLNNDPEAVVFYSTRYEDDLLMKYLECLFPEKCIISRWKISWLKLSADCLPLTGRGRARVERFPEGYVIDFVVGPFVPCGVSASTTVRPSDACVLRRLRLTVVDNTGSRASAVSTTPATAATARKRRSDGWTDGRSSKSESGQSSHRWRLIIG